MESECLVNVKSSNINAIGYDEGKGVLEVWFKNRRAYVFFNVKKQTYEDFLKAESKGKFFYANIRGKFECVRIR